MARGMDAGHGLGHEQSMTKCKVEEVGVIWPLLAQISACDQQTKHEKSVFQKDRV